MVDRLSQEWLTIQDSYTTNDDIYRESYVWASSIVEISIKNIYGIMGTAKQRRPWKNRSATTIQTTSKTQNRNSKTPQPKGPDLTQR